MEAQRDGFLEEIIPPRLEDAGLEDCALSPNSIRQAFFKAAGLSPSSDCVDDPVPEGPSDSVVGIMEGFDTVGGACSGEKQGGLPVVIGDEVGVGITEAEEKVDRIVGPEVEKEEKGKDFVNDALEGLELRERESKEQDDHKKPILF